MSKNKNIKPTPAELDILQILWKNDSATVKVINEELNKVRKVGYTTTLKLMQIMYEKGLLKRVRSGKSHVYTALYQKSETQKVLLEKILESAFAGSASKLVMQALGRSRTSKEEIEEIKKYLAELEEKENESQ